MSRVCMCTNCGVAADPFESYVAAADILAYRVQEAYLYLTSKQLQDIFNASVKDYWRKRGELEYPPQRGG